MNTNLRKPCGECPFRKKSMKGWLGPWRPETILAQIKYGPFACHRTIEEDGVITPGLESCAGAAIFLNNHLCLSRDKTTSEHQRKLVVKGGVDSVFKTPAEFMEHHNDV